MCMARVDGERLALVRSGSKLPLNAGQVCKHTLAALACGGCVVCMAMRQRASPGARGAGSSPSPCTAAPLRKQLLTSVVPYCFTSSGRWLRLGRLA